MAFKSAPPAFFVTKLRSARRRWLTWEIAGALCRLTTFLAAMALGLIAWETSLRPTIFSRYLVVYGICLPAFLAAAGLWLKQAIAGKRLRAAAWRVQGHYPRLGGRLVCGLDLLALPRTPLVAAALRQLDEELSSLDFTPAIVTAQPRQSALAATLALALLAFVAVGWPERCANAAARLLFPAEVEATVGAVRLLSVSPGDIEVVEGASVEIAARVDRPQWVNEAWLEIVAHDDKAKTVSAAPVGRRALAQTGSDIFAYTLRDLHAACRYRLCFGDTRSAWHAIGVLPRPAVTAISGLITPPAYTGLAPFALPPGGGSIRAPIGSAVALRITTNHPVREGRLHFSSGAETPLVFAGERLAASFTVNQSGFYTVALVDGSGHANVNPPPHAIEAIPDLLPRVRLLANNKGGAIGLDEEIALRLEADDDYGLREIKICFRRNRLGEVQVLQTWPIMGSQAKTVALTHGWRIAQPHFEVGDEICCFAEATDFCPDGERISRSSPLVFTVIDRQQAVRQTMTALEDAQRRLTNLLTAQKEIHRATADFPTNDANAAGRAAKLRGQQVGVRAGVADVAAAIAGLADAAGRRIRAVLRGLVATELAEAVAALDELAQADVPQAQQAAITRALPPQAEVIHRLSEILGILPEMKAALVEPPPAEKGSDLKTAGDALGKLKDDLEKFKEAQRKAVDATEALSKKPVEDFTDEDRQQLAAMQAAEEDWAKFLKETISDLSRLPPQDFSNPTVAADLLAILEEVEIAAGAMQRLETRIATTAATTAMELAESLTAHLEKWLPDAPDRVAWSMEEPLSDYEIPMAELPEKLEDIVGDLLEQEEDLMQEAEDESSSWADSIDKGAGWDALDGPISNYSAQGVTGNQLPNDTEISGRAGQGRQGKSHGEMVADAAVDKDGRRTPSRLTPDPFEKGKIDDQSTKAGGGATGGGKEGGWGGRGLEGQAPAPNQEAAPRLSGKQAELRNRAERLQSSLKQLGYNIAVLENTLREFRAIEDELKSGRYRHASRRAAYAISALRTAKDDLLGQAEVRLDRAAGLPRDLQREIMDAFEAGLPRGYEEIIQTYYHRLSEGRE